MLKLPLSGPTGGERSKLKKSHKHIREMIQRSSTVWLQMPLVTLAEEIFTIVIAHA